MKGREGNRLLIHPPHVQDTRLIPCRRATNPHHRGNYRPKNKKNMRGSCCWIWIRPREDQKPRSMSMRYESIEGIQTMPMELGEDLTTNGQGFYPGSAVLFSVLALLSRWGRRNWRVTNPHYRSEKKGKSPIEKGSPNLKPVLRALVLQPTLSATSAVSWCVQKSLVRWVDFFALSCSSVQSEPRHSVFFQPPAMTYTCCDIA